MKRKFLLLFFVIILIISACYKRAKFQSFSPSSFSTVYKNPIYYKLGNKIFFSNDLNVDKKDKLIYKKALDHHFVSPDYFYILIQTKKRTMVLFDKNGKKYKEFGNIIMTNSIVWSADSNQILLTKITNKKIQLIVYQIREKKLINIPLLEIPYGQDSFGVYGWYRDYRQFYKTRYQLAFSKNGKFLYSFNSKTIYKIRINPLRKKWIQQQLSHMKEEISDNIFMYLHKIHFQSGYLPYFLDKRNLNLKCKVVERGTFRVYSLLSYDLKIHLFYSRFSIPFLPNLWVKHNGQFRKILRIVQGAGFNYPGSYPDLYMEFLLGNRYINLYVDTRNFLGYLLYDLKTNQYKKILKPSLFPFRAGTTKYDGYTRSNYSRKAKTYFRYLFPITSKNTGLSLKDFFSLEKKKFILEIASNRTWSLQSLLRDREGNFSYKNYKNIFFEILKEEENNEN